MEKERKNLNKIKLYAGHIKQYKDNIERILEEVANTLPFFKKLDKDNNQLLEKWISKFEKSLKSLKTAEKEATDLFKEMMQHIQEKEPQTRKIIEHNYFNKIEICDLEKEKDEDEDKDDRKYF